MSTRKFAANLTDKIYFAIFALLGHVWYKQSMTTTWPIIGLMIAFYFFHNVVMKKGKAYISNYFLPFLLLGVCLVFHGFATKFPQLLTLTANSYHSSWGSLAAGFGMFINMLTLYVMFRLICRFQEKDSSMFYDGFALGFNIFMIQLIMYGKYSYSGYFSSDVYGTESVGIAFRGEVLNINGIGPLFLQIFYVNLLALMHQKRILLRIYHVVFCAAALVVVYMAQSRTSTGALLIGMGVVFAVRKPKAFTLILASCIFVLAVFWSSFDGFEELNDFLPKRYSYADIARSIQHGNTGRADIWHDYLSNAMSAKTLLFGEGPGGSSALLYQKPLRQRRPPVVTALNYDSLFYPHSTYISIFIDFGCIGFTFYLLVLATILVRLINGVRHRQIHWVYLAMHITLILWGLSEGNLFSSMFLLFMPLILPEVCNKNKHPMITLDDFCRIFLNRKAILILSTSASIVFCLLVCLFAPQSYKSKCVITPSGNAYFPVRFQGAVTARILRGRTIVEKTAEKFDLMNVYGKHTMSETVDFLQENIVHANDTLLGDMITLEILDTSPDRAVQISAFMLECLNEHIHKMFYDMDAGFEAFYDSELANAQLELAEAEDDLSAFQKENGIISPNQQVSSLVRRINSLREDIAAKERELFRLRTYASSGNSRIKLAEARLSAMRYELHNLELDTEGFATKTIPAVRAAYNDKLRHVEFLRAKVLSALNALEKFQRDPLKYLPPVYVIDAVYGSVEEFKPYRFAVMIGGTFTGIWLGLTLCVIDYVCKGA